MSVKELSAPRRASSGKRRSAVTPFRLQSSGQHAEGGFRIRKRLLASLIPPCRRVGYVASSQIHIGRKKEYLWPSFREALPVGAAEQKLNSRRVNTSLQIFLCCPQDRRRT